MRPISGGKPPAVFRFLLPAMFLALTAYFAYARHLGMQTGANHGWAFHGLAFLVLPWGPLVLLAFGLYTPYVDAITYGSLATNAAILWLLGAWFDRGLRSRRESN